MSLTYTEKRALQKDILKNRKIYGKTRFARQGHDKYFCETSVKKIQLDFDKLDGIENKQYPEILYDKINNLYTEYQSSNKTLEDIFNLQNNIRKLLDILDFPHHTDMAVRQNYLETFFNSEIASLLANETKKAREIILQNCQNKLPEFNKNMNNIKEKHVIYNKTLNHAIEVHEKYLKHIIQSIKEQFDIDFLDLNIIKSRCKNKKDYYQQLQTIFLTLYFKANQFGLDQAIYEQLKIKFQEEHEECEIAQQRHNHEFLTLNNECETSLQNLTDRLLELSTVSEEQGKQWFYDHVVISEALYKQLDGSTKKILTESIIEAYRLTGGKVKNLSLDITKSARSYMTSGGNTIYLNSKQIDKRTLFHEFGHLVEFSDPMLREMSTSFIEARATGKPVSLRKLAPNIRFRSDEVAYPDHFAHPYIGKVYPGGITEVVSMALEVFGEKNDPDKVKVAERIAKDTEDIQLLLGKLLMEADNAPTSQ